MSPWAAFRSGRTAASSSWSRTTSDSDRVAYKGDLPDLFREGQGVVAKGAFRPDGVFEANEILAKHDERYMPRELVRR